MAWPIKHPLMQQLLSFRYEQDNGFGIVCFNGTGGVQQ